MTGPRVQFVRGIRPVRDPQPSSLRLPVTWRLLGANQRELGRSAASYPDAVAARASVAAVQTELSTAVVSVSVDHVTGLWTWRLRIEGVDALVSSRSYQRRRESESNVARALEALPVATFAKDELDLLAGRGRRGEVSSRTPAVQLAGTYRA